MPLLEKRYQDADGKWLFAKCNVDEFGELAQAFQVESSKKIILRSARFLPYFLYMEEKLKIVILCLSKILDFLGLPSEKEIDEFIKKAIDLNKTS